MMDDDTVHKILLQRKYCDENNVPCFAPRYDHSWCCGKNIWEKISEKKASGEWITGCPICHRSFVD
jgi:hypothetical protein